MDKILIPFIIIACLLATACDNNDEPDPIRFGQQSYTIKAWVTTPIYFVDGGGVYDISIGDKSVIGKAYIDVDSDCLLVTPVATGESTITIRDKKADKSVILNIKVIDFYSGFKITDIDGTNVNPYISLGKEIRFIRKMDGNRSLEIVSPDEDSSDVNVIGSGVFDIAFRDTGFTMDMVLHQNENEELELFSYSMSGSNNLFDIFNHYFDYGWEKMPAARSLPMARIEMELTDIYNNCRITTVLMPR